jgi:hypothetical protein
VRSAARSAMSLRSPSVADITVRCIAHATSARGGGRPALTQSKLPAGSGKRRAEWDSGSLNDRYHLGRMHLPQRCRRPCTRRSHHGRTLALSPNVSCAFAILTPPCLIAWAPMKRDYGARPRKRFGPSRRCDSRRLQCGNDCATGRALHLGSGKVGPG